MASIASYVAALACIAAFCVERPDAVSKPANGVDVLLASACPADAIGDRRDLVVRYLPGARLWLNEASLDEKDLRSRLQQSLTTRAEQLIWLAADERVSYGEVVSMISKLKLDNPKAYVALVTKSQVGPVDPSDSEFRKAQMNPGLGIYTLCVGFRPETLQNRHFR
jgi:biopolymer transport protein ExbD